ncbi:type II secretory protein pull [Pseudomonas sp. SDI]|uniref:type II secretion system protein GspL n=1 Tax=Pseudomonas sp. SDI TaxID=2170734 RepID=UPI000DE7B292|nr:type II secretion system protein GspL [Pseudomonas sp. SDI]PWB31110.1 type II secretory protein pull [Pseudomonas sp. SDI]
MSEHWLYLLPDGLAAPGSDWPTWRWRSDSQTPLAAPLHEAAQALGAVPMVLVLPQEMLGWDLCPALGRWPSRQALGFALEEQLAQPLETLHLAFGAALDDRRRAVLSVDRERFAAVLTLLAGHGLSALAVHADADLLAAEAPCAVWQAGRWLLGGGQAPRLALSAADAELLKPSLAALQWLPEAPLPTRRTGAIDLLQGALRRRRKVLAWQAPVLTALLLLALACGFNELRTAGVNARLGALQVLNDKRFEALYPGVRRHDDLFAQLASLQQQAAPDTRLQRLAVISEAIVATGNLRLERVELQASGGWRLELLAEDLADLERLRQGRPQLALVQANMGAEGVQAQLLWEDEA